MESPAQRFARVRHTVTIDFDLDLGAGTVVQVLVDHTAPLRAFGLPDEGDEEGAELPPEDRETALGLVIHSTDPWSRWALFGEDPIRPEVDPGAIPPF
jgi:hypothetical protein